MSDWVGPTVYRILNYKDRNTAVVVQDGKKDEGTNVVMKAGTGHGKHDKWLFSYVGIGVSGKEEFLIISRSIGLHLTAVEGPKQGPLRLTRDSPTFYRTRWNIAPTRNGTGTFLIVAASDNKMKLAPVDGGTADDTKVQMWDGSMGDTSSWWYLELDDSVSFPCADLGKVPIPSTEADKHPNLPTDQGKDPNLPTDQGKDQDPSGDQGKDTNLPTDLGKDPIPSTDLDKTPIPSTKPKKAPKE